MSTELRKPFAKIAGTENPEECQYHLCWYGNRIGSFSVCDQEIRWKQYKEKEYEALFPKRESDGAPNFLVNIDPSNPIFKRLQEGTQTEYIKGGLRFLSNLTISQNCPFDRPTQLDTLLTRLDDHINDGTFVGYYAGICPKTLDNSFENEIASLWANHYTPRFSGKEIKVPTTLNEGGILQVSITSPFTHFVKFPLGEHREGWAVNEWMCLELSDHIGLDTAQHALLPLRNGLPPAIIVERFDIPQSPEEKGKWLLIEDFCTLEGIPSTDLNKGSMEKIAKLVRENSTEPDEDMERLYKRTILSWAIKDNDMHRKNISMLMEYDPGSKNITKTRLAPTYDVTSEIHQEDRRQKMCLTIQGKTSGINKKTLLRFGETLGFSPEQAEQILTDVVTSIAEKAVDIANNLPEVAQKHNDCVYAAQRIATLAVKSAKTIGAPTPEWTETERIPVNNGAIGRTHKSEHVRPKFL